MLSNIAAPLNLEIIEGSKYQIKKLVRKLGLLIFLPKTKLELKEPSDILTDAINFP